MKQRRKERGVALLLALGLLSLLLILGLAFVSNSLLARKIASNNGSRSLARIFAHSAINRVQASLMLYQQQADASDTHQLPNSFERIYSKDPDFNLNDQLLGDNSKLRLPEDDSVISKTAAEKYNKPFKDSSWQGSWVPIYSDSSSSATDRKIIGRAAWQVLGSSSEILASVFFRGHLTPYIFSGSLYNYTDGATATMESVAWKTNKHRWGKEIDEVRLEGTTYLNGVPTLWPTGTTSKPKDWKTIAVTDWGTLWTSLGITAPEEQQWVKKWLSADLAGATAANPTPVYDEAYQYQKGRSSKRFHRFNISELFPQGTDAKQYYKRYFGNAVQPCTDPWYARFGIADGAAKGRNDRTAIENLTRDSIVFRSTDSSDWEMDSYGLPFLRRIGNDPAGFDDLAHRRMQIAANFNDYCDADSIPTSDIHAAEWSVTDETKYPSYTGNENTLAINEVAFLAEKLKFTFSHGKDMLANHNVALKITFPELYAYAELINIYNTALPDGSAANHKMQLLLKSLQLRIKPTVTYTIDYTYSSGTPAVDTKVTGASFSCNFAGTTFAPAATPYHTLSLREGEGGNVISDKVIEWSDFVTGTYGYSSKLLLVKQGGGNVVLGMESALDPSAYIVSQLNKKAKATTVTPAEKRLPANGTLKSIDKVEIAKVTWSFPVSPMKLGPAKLHDGNTNVDFVRFDRLKTLWIKMVSTSSRTVLNDGVQAKQTKEGDDLDLSCQADNGGANNGSFVIGGLEALDPRANLNPKLEAPSDDESTAQSVSNLKSDWWIKPSLSSAVAATKTNATYPRTMVLANDTGNKYLSERIAGATPGRYNINAGSTPSSAKLGDTTTAPALGTCDKETGSYVGWYNSSNHLSTAFIRNAPMQSAWEIGVIHRGAPWETINIKSAGKPGGGAFDLGAHEPVGDVTADANWGKSGTAYADGDGAILDQIKLSEYARTYGKINVNLLSQSDDQFNAEYDLDIVKALFTGIRYGQTMANLITASTRAADTWRFPTATEGGTAITVDKITADILSNISKNDSIRPFVSRAQFVGWGHNAEDLTAPRLANGFGMIDISAKLDLQQEELIGKTIGLLSAERVLPNVVQIVVVAQTIDDRQGMQIVNPDDSTNGRKDCSYGTFDVKINDNSDEDKNYYFDRITGEVKMLVTLDRDPTTGRMSVRRIDYLD